MKTKKKVEKKLKSLLVRPLTGFFLKESATKDVSTATRRHQILHNDPNLCAAQFECTDAQAGKEFPHPEVLLVLVAK